MIAPTQAAKAIKKEIKAMFPHGRVRCVTERYAGGSSVDVIVEEYMKQTAEKISQKYQYGAFDGYNDAPSCVFNEAIPQAKFIFVRAWINSEVK